MIYNMRPLLRESCKFDSTSDHLFHTDISVDTRSCLYSVDIYPGIKRKQINYSKLQHNNYTLKTIYQTVVIFMILFYSDFVWSVYDIIRHFFSNTYRKCILNVTCNFNYQFSPIRIFERRVDLALQIRSKQCICTERTIVCTQYLFTKKNMYM